MNKLCNCEEGTVLNELLQVIRVSGQLEDERGPSDLLLDVFIQQLHILIDAVDSRLLLQLKGEKTASGPHILWKHLLAAALTHVSLSSYLNSCVRCEVSR